jgi:hypothetical protein
MIFASVRERVTEADRALALALLARNNPGRRSSYGALAAEGSDRLLDEPELFDLLGAVPLGAAPSAALYLYVAARHHLRGVGVDHAAASDYLGALLLEFGLRDRAHRIAAVDDAVYAYATDVASDLEAADGRRGFLLRAHLGNFSLWLAGVFPDHIAARRARKGGPDLAYYDTLGARGFRLAAEHRLARECGLNEVFGRIADSFAPIRVALNRWSDRYMFPAGGGADRLVRQVTDATRFN